MRERGGGRRGSNAFCHGLLFIIYFGVLFFWKRFIVYYLVFFYSLVLYIELKVEELFGKRGHTGKGWPNRNSKNCGMLLTIDTTGVPMPPHTFYVYMHFQRL
jgi:hypothetical protein